MFDKTQRTSDIRKRAAELLLSPKREDIVDFIEHDLEDILQELDQLQAYKIQHREDIQLAKGTILKERENAEQLFHSAPIACLTIDSNNRILKVNFAASTLLGVEHKVLVDNKLSKFLTTKSLTDLEVLKQDSLTTLPIATQQLHFHGGDTNIVTLAQVTRKETHIQDNIHFRLALIDVSQQANTVQKLEESESIYRAIVQSACDCYVITNEAGYIVDALCPEFLFDSKQLKGGSILRFFDLLLDETQTEDDRRKLLHELQHFYKSGQADFLGVNIETTAVGGHRLRYRSISFKTQKGFRLITTVHREKDVLKNAIIDDHRIVTENQFKSLIEQANIGIFKLTTEGVYSYISESWAKMMGYTPAQIIGKSFIPITHPDDLSLYKLFMQRVLEKQVKIGGLEYRIKHNNGSWKWHQVSVSPELNEHGKTKAIIGVTNDITTRKFTELAWSESERKFRALFENMVSGFALLQVVYDKYAKITDSVVVEINPAFERITELSRLNAIGQNVLAILPEVGGVLVTKYKLIQQHKRSIQFIYYSKKLNKHFDIILYSASEKHIAAVFNDITEQKENEKKLLQASQELSIIFEYTPSILLLIDSDQRVVKINKTGEQYQTSHPIGTSNILYSGDILNCVNAWKSKGCGTDEACNSCSLRWIIGKCFAEKKNQSNIEVAFSIRRNEKTTKLNIIVSTVYVPDVESPKVLLSVNDITQEKRMEEALFENEERYRLLSDLTSEGIILNQDAKIIDFNPAFCKIGNWSRNDIIHAGFFEKLFNKSAIRRINKHINTTEQGSFETEINTPDGTLIPVSITIYCFLFKGKTAQVITFRDLREQREIQMQITKTIINTEEKDRSYFARELHDGLGPLLSTAKIYSKAASTSKDESRRIFALEKLNETIQESILSVQEISNRLSPHVLDNFGLEAALQTFCAKVNALKTLEVSISSTLKSRLDRNSEVMLYRVLVELINNTLKHGKATKINIAILASDKDTRIQYTDNGVGFDVEQTIKEHHGMGLYNILNRIKTLNGKVAIKSKLSEGVSVKIELPSS